MLGKVWLLNTWASEHNKNVFDLELVGRLIAVGIKQSEAQDIYATTDEGSLRNAIHVVEQRLKNHALQELKSPQAYFRDALKKGYKAAKEEDQAGVGQSSAEKVNQELQYTRGDAVGPSKLRPQAHCQLGRHGFQCAHGEHGLP